MIGIVDVGGGLRGIYGAGVFDWCLENGVEFDYLAGVSAGGANIMSFLAGQKGRNFRFYTEYSFRKEYMGVERLLKTGNYLDLEYIYGDALSNEGGEYPLDYDRMIGSGKQAVIVATNALTGLPVYFDLYGMERNDYGPVKASCCVPIADRPYEWKGSKYYDGGLSDPIPYRKAMEAGCEKVVVILTRPVTYMRSDRRDARFSKFLKKKYPNCQKALRNRAKLYNGQLVEARELAEKGKVLIVAPDDIGKMSTLTRDKDALMEMYAKGKKDAEAIRAYVS